MALATATRCQVDADIRYLVDSLPFWTQSEVFTNAEALILETERLVNSALSDPFGANLFDPRFSRDDNCQSAVMKLLDTASHAIVDRNIDRQIKRRAIDPRKCRLALCGGYALNSPNNTRVMDKYRFDKLLCPPCANDGGQALGLGIMGITSMERNRAPQLLFKMPTAYYGSSKLNLSAALRHFSEFIEDVTDLDIEKAVDDIENGPVAWVQGAAEIGPRALGHRSILGDPRQEITKHRINEIKQREWWRPVAPTILRGAVEKWFLNDRPSPFMLEVFMSRQTMRKYSRR